MNCHVFVLYIVYFNSILHCPGEYYCINLLLIIIAIFVSVFVIFVNRRAETKQIPPKWIKFVSETS